MKTIDDWIRLQEDREMFSILAKRLSYYEGIGVLIEDGLIDIGLVAKLSSGNIISFWERFGDGVKAIREYYNWPRWAIMVEYLYDQVIKYSEKHPELMITIPENR